MLELLSYSAGLSIEGIGMSDLMKILVILQCAWYHNGNARKRQTWEKGLWRSHTGRRLRKMLPDSDNLVVTVINSTGEIGTRPQAILPADLTHISNWLNEVVPDLVISFGVIAHGALSKMGIAHIAVTHPAWRQLGTEQVKQIRADLEHVVNIWPGYKEGKDPGK